MTTPPERPLSLSEASKRWGMGTQNLRLRIRQGKLRAQKLMGGQWRIPVAEVVRVESEGFK